ncbi:hypothetical protein MBLNU457_g0488t1 [Dothideomycetes sp. NU457]
MGSSAKRKKEKKADFTKPKLKVGKTAPKAANSTSTAFKAKSIVLNQTTLSSSAPSSTALFTHQLSLLSSKQDTQRKDALQSLTNSLTNLQDSDPLPQPAISILHKARPLLIDPSKAIRENTLKLLRALPGAEIAPNVANVLIYIHIGMTHMSPPIRESSLGVLSFLLEVAGQETVGCPGGWVKSLRRFMGMLNWAAKTPTLTTSATEKDGDRDKDAWTSTSASKPADAKLRAKTMTVLAQFLATGLKTPDELDSVEMRRARAGRIWPLRNTEMHVLGHKANPYGYLNLFGTVRDEEGEMYDDAESRAEVYGELFHEGVLKGMRAAKREGGEVGRAGNALDKVIGGFGQ